VSVLVLDIETVRDPAVWSPPEDEPDKFPPPHACRPIVIGMVLLEVDGPTMATRRIGALSGDEERPLLEGFGRSLAAAAKGQGRPALVTWNGRAFDLPVLMLRSLRYGIGQRWYYGSRDTRYRYTEEGHCDLADAMGDYGACRALGLDGMARLIGLPGKPTGADEVTGANVGAAYAAGRLEEITNYCIADAVQTAFLWLRWAVLKGEVDLDAYQVAAGDLLVPATRPAPRQARRRRRPAGAAARGRVARGGGMTGTADEVLEELLEDLRALTFGPHQPGDCPLADPDTGICDACHVLDQVTEAVVAAENRLDKVRLGVVAA
jgi:predicted PolB exonuclease-like 3'-5' exonuclease